MNSFAGTCEHGRYNCSLCGRTVAAGSWQTNESSGLSSTSGTCTCQDRTAWPGSGRLPGCPFYVPVPIVYEPVRGAGLPTYRNVPVPAAGGKCCGHIKEHHRPQSAVLAGKLIEGGILHCGWRGCGCPEWVE